MFHTIVGHNTKEQMEEVYKLGSNTSYFAESAYDLNTADYAEFYWGKNAQRL